MAYAQGRRRIFKVGKILSAPFIGGTKSPIWVPNLRYICYSEGNLVIKSVIAGRIAVKRKQKITSPCTVRTLIAVFMCSQYNHAKYCLKERLSALYVKQLTK